MTAIGISPICLTCSRFNGVQAGVGYVCQAFRDQAIPIDILSSRVDHRQPYDGDGGLQYVPKISQDDAKYCAVSTDHEQCRGCQRFLLPNGCRIVAGQISPYGWCPEWLESLGIRADSVFNESDHPRGQPENAGQFTAGGGGSALVKAGNYVKTKSGAGFTVRKVEDGRVFPSTGRGVPLEDITSFRDKPGEGEWRSPGVEAGASEHPKQEDTPSSAKEEVDTPAPPIGGNEAPSQSNSARRKAAEKEARLPDKEFSGKFGVSISGSGAKKQQIKTAIAQLPPSALRMLKDSGVRIVSQSEALSGAAHSHVAEYRPSSKTIIIPDVYLVRGSKQYLKDPIGITTHEIGHAIDFHSSLKFSKDFEQAVDEDAKGLRKSDKDYASHFFSNPKEKFAELFRLAFSGNGGFEKTQGSAEKVFAKSLALIRSEFGAEARDDSEEDAEPITAAGVMHVAPSGRVLMLRRTTEGDQAGKWAFPGGKLEDGETAEEAALRECEEEIGHRPEGLKHWMRSNTRGVDFTTFITPVDEEFEPDLNDEHDAFEWVEFPGFGSIASRLDKSFTESDHPRGQPGHPGQFVAKGGGGGSPSSGVGERPSPSYPLHRAASRAGASVKRAAASFSHEDYEILHHHLGSAGSGERKSFVGKLKGAAKSVPALVKAHVIEEKEKAVFASKALKSLATGKRPSPEEMKGLRQFSTTVVLSSVSLALHDPTGSVGHIFAELVHEVIEHTIVEHAAKFGAAAGRMVFKRRHDAEDDEPDAKELEEFLEEVFKNLEEAELKKKEQGDKRSDGASQDRMKSLLQQTGIPYKEIQVYGSQIMVTTASLNAANEFASAISKFARVRKVFESVDGNMTNQPGQSKAGGAEYHKVWRIAAVVDDIRADKEFKETDHPRDEDGKFTDGGGGSAGIAGEGDYVKSGTRTFYVRKIENGRVYPTSGKSYPVEEVQVVRSKSDLDKMRAEVSAAKTQPEQTPSPPPVTLSTPPSSQTTRQQTYEDRQAFRRYTSHEFQYANAVARGRSANLGRPQLASGNDLLPKLDKAWETIKPTDKNLTLFRGVHTVEATLGIDVGHLDDLVGTDFKDSGWLSTSSNKDKALEFASGSLDKKKPDYKGSLLFKVEVPSGTRVLDVNKTIGTEGGAYGNENEHVLPRDSLFRVTSVDKTHRPPIVTLEMSTVRGDSTDHPAEVVRLDFIDDDARADFNESDHPRGQPDNPGQFVEGGGGGSSSKSASASKLVSLEKKDWPAHIQKLKLPPAWTDVQISTDPNAPLQAIGRDSKGRPQYVYSAKFKESQAAKKFDRIKQLDKKYDSIVSKNDRLLKSKNASVREHASVTALILEMGLRPGSERETGAEEQAYGATTLTAEHVLTTGTQTWLRFTGKKGVKLRLPVENPAMAAELKERAKAGGQLFPGVTEVSLRKYVATVAGAGIKTKDLRTLKGTRIAAQLVKEHGPLKSMAEYKREVKAVAQRVSEVLGNTPTIALQSYISPYIFSGWKADVEQASKKAAA